MNTLCNYKNRYLKERKSDVGNPARPEGSMAEAYIARECLNFVSQYLKGIESSSQARNNASNESQEDESGLFPSEGTPYGSIQGFRMDENTWKQAHRYVLFNCEDTNLESLKK